MASFIVEGNHRLHGEIVPQGAKNEALEVICATMLTTEEVIIENVPDILDVNNLIQLLSDMGVILDFEFYFYNKNHRDISVHPRKSEALCWYFNDFGGIDLNFKSEIEKEAENSLKYKFTENSYFGGILIRQIQNTRDKMIYDGRRIICTQ